MPPAQFVSRVELKRDTVPTFDTYPFCLPAVRAMDRLELHPRLTVFVGENGSGKSTLLEAIAVGLGLNAEGGGRNFRFGTRASHSDLHGHLRLVRSHRRPRDAFSFEPRASSTSRPRSSGSTPIQQQAPR